MKKLPKVPQNDAILLGLTLITALSWMWSAIIGDPMPVFVVILVDLLAFVGLMYRIVRYE